MPVWNEPVPVVVIFGPKGSGKDEFGNALAGEFNEALPCFPTREPTAVHGFGDPMRETLHALLGIPMGTLRGPAKDEVVAYGQKLRFWQRLIATDVFRDMVHPDVLAHAAVRTVLSGKPTKAHVFCDSRMVNEWELAKAVLQNGFPTPWEASMPFGGGTVVPPGSFRCFLYEVRRPGATGDAHRTETSFDALRAHSPTVVDNDGALEELHAKAKKAAKKVAAECREDRKPPWEAGLRAEILKETDGVPDRWVGAEGVVAISSMGEEHMQNAKLLLERWAEDEAMARREKDPTPYYGPFHAALVAEQERRLMPWKTSSKPGLAT